MPVRIVLSTPTVSTDDQELIRCPAVGEGDLYCGGGRQGRSHAGHNLYLDAYLPQNIQFLPCATKNQRITTFQPHDDLS